MDQEIVTRIPRRALSTLPANVVQSIDDNIIKNENINRVYVGDNVPKAVAKKATLMKKLEVRYSKSPQKPYSAPKYACRQEYGIYEMEYFAHLAGEERLYVLDRDFCKGTKISSSWRHEIVDWLIKQQQYLKVTDSDFYMAVKIMDLNLKLCARRREGKLLAITSLWMVHKISGIPNVNIMLSTLITMAKLNNEFCQEDIIFMERKILEALKFKIILPEPSIFLEHYLEKTNLVKNKLIRQGSYFICDCISKFTNFSYVKPSRIAVIALYTALTVLEEDHSVLDSVIIPKDKERVVRCSEDMLQKIKQINDSNIHREPFIKYANMDVVWYFYNLD